MSPAFCADGYTIYCDWCEAHRRTPPTRAWWNKACAQPRGQADRRLSDCEFDIQTEQRSGWAYGERI